MSKQRPVGNDDSRTLTEKSDTTQRPQAPELPVMTVEDQENYARYRFERQQRMRIIMIVAPGVIGLIMLILPTDTVFRFFSYSKPEFYYERFRAMFSLAALGMFAASALAVIMHYLQTGFKRDYRETEKLRDYEKDLQRLRTEISQTQSGPNLKDLTSLGDRISKLEGDLASTTKDLTGEKRDQLVAEIAKRIRAEASEELLQSFEEQAKNSFMRMQLAMGIDEQLTASLSRLNGEVTALGFRSNLNLGLGMITTIAGLVYLGYYVIQSANADNMTVFALHFIPRLSLVVFIEIFAYFFLKLYKLNLAEIKYFQNEMTNFESKFVALHTAQAIDDKSSIATVIEKLANTDRNYILKKGETTVQLEQQKIDKELTAEITKSVTEAVTTAVKSTARR
jgi:hypothetical protein